MPSVSEPNLAQLRAFAAVADARSYRRAAIQLGVSPSAVSQAVRALEAQLGIPLLQRTTRSVAPNEAGHRLLAELLPHLEGLDVALRHADTGRGEPAGTLRINLPRIAACLLMEPLVAPFLAAHPQIHLELTTQDGFVDIVAAGCDAGIRFAESVPLDMVAITLGGPQRFIVVGSPALLQRRARPAEPWDLLAQPCVRLRFPSGALYHWEFQQPDGTPFALDVPGPLTVDDQRMSLRAALDGVGWVYLQEAAALPHLASGELVRVLDDWLPPGTPFQLYYPDRRQAAPPLRAFIDWWRKSQPPA